mmetsp:Transcript_17962/g.29133  ORF Transcript_17962/g.29133 Transcript_17962/m.29133 type:complete len:194 (+) Transcript_17962:2244-2825(+)
MGLCADEGCIVTPGTLLVQGLDEAKVKNGSGTYVAQDGVYASIVGRFEYEDNVVAVVPASYKPRIVPVVNDIVTCKVLKVNSRFATCEIACVGSRNVPGTGFKGIIRKENVRGFEIDRVEMHKSFRPRDIVRAMVASLGTARSYELSTAGNNLGVVSAFSEANAPMIPVSYNEMKCSLTGVIENRKVAKLEAK